MKRMAILAVALLVAGGAAAQTPPTAPAEDSRVTAYQQLLSRANDELARAIAQTNTLATENTKLKADLEKLQKPDKKE